MNHMSIYEAIRVERAMQFAYPDALILKDRIIGEDAIQGIRFSMFYATSPDTSQAITAYIRSELDWDHEKRRIADEVRKAEVIASLRTVEVVNNSHKLARKEREKVTVNG